MTARVWNAAVASCISVSSRAASFDFAGVALSTGLLAAIAEEHL